MKKTLFEDNLNAFSRFSSRAQEILNSQSKTLTDTFKQAQEDASVFLEKKVPSIAIWGVGSGYHYEALKGWLHASKSHSIVFIEDDLGALRAFLEMGRASVILSDPQISFALVDQESPENIKAFAALSPDFYFLREKRVIHQIYATHAYLAEVWLYKEQANIYYHLAHINEYSPSRGLSIPCPWVICGAGPSLAGHMDDLNNELFLVASGTAMNLLNDASVMPDLGVAFDSKKSGSRRLQANSAFHVPFLVDLEATDGVRYLQGPKVLTRQAKLAPWKKNLLDKLGIADQIAEIGPCITSTHYAIECGKAFGAICEYLIGVDLAYVNGVQYGGGENWIQDHDVKNRRDLIAIDKEKTVSRTYLMERALYSAMEGVEFCKQVPDASKETFLIPPCFDISNVKEVLQEWRQELEKNPETLLIGYRKKLELLHQDQERVCRDIVDFHLKSIDQALMEIDDSICYDFSADKLPMQNGKLNGRVQLYYGPGKLKAEIDYENGHRKGLYRFYRPDGKIMEERYVENF